MNQNDEALQTFMSLGLTSLQAKIYLTLVKIGNGGIGVRQISRESGIARQDIYRILPSLQKIGLIQKVIASPTLYKPVNIDTGFYVLLEQKSEQYKEMQKKAANALSNFIANNDQKIESAENPPQFTITSGKNLLFKTLGDTLMRAQANIDVICSVENIKLVIFYGLPLLQKSIERGVRIRIVTEEASKELIEKNEKEFKNLLSDAFQIRFVSGLVSMGLAIFDNKDASICVTSDLIVPSLWTKNPNVLTLATTYFEVVWNKSKPLLDLEKLSASQ